jgi:hypothetical protein
MMTRPASAFVAAIRGPVMLIALGLLMAADQMDWIGIERTWPVLLILFGVLKVAAHLSGGRAE